MKQTAYSLIASFNCSLNPHLNNQFIGDSSSRGRCVIILYAELSNVFGQFTCCVLDHGDHRNHMTRQLLFADPRIMVNLAAMTELDSLSGIHNR